MSKRALILWRMAVAVVILGIWQAVSGPLIDPFWLSTPVRIGISLWHSLRSGVLESDLLITFQETIYGYVIGAVIGLVLALALGQSERVADVLKPYILAVYGIPRIALAPIFVLWFGIAIESKVMMAAMVTALLVFFNTYEGVRATSLDLRNVAKVLGASRWRLFWHVTIPDASPWIIAGLRIAIPQALVGAVVAEFIASTAGLGYRIMETTSVLDTAGTMAGIFVLMVVVVALGSILDRVEVRLLRWRPRESDTRGQ